MEEPKADKPFEKGHIASYKPWPPWRGRWKKAKVSEEKKDTTVSRQHQPEPWDDGYQTALRAVRDALRKTIDDMKARPLQDRSPAMLVIDETLLSFSKGGRFEVKE